MRAIKKRLPKARMIGVGGPLMRAEGLDCLMPMEEFQIMGFVQVLRHLPQLWKKFGRIREAILSAKPAIVIGIDYPGWNIRMAQALKKRHFSGKLVQYISPTVWAWGKGRVQKMAKCLDLLLTILPFEQECYASTTLPVHYVGHPTLESIRRYKYDPNWKETAALPQVAQLIALFPGSRPEELKRNLAKQLEAAHLLKKEQPTRFFAISCAHADYQPVIHQAASSFGLLSGKDYCLVPSQQSYDLMFHCDGALAKSGTVTLELALHQKPTVVTYEISKWNRFFAQYIFRINLPFYCIVNILAKNELFPEFIKQSFTGQDLAQKLQPLLKIGPKRSACIKGCQQLTAILGEKFASDEAAKAIEELLL